jgi:preprotein translocase subunit SecA
MHSVDVWVQNMDGVPFSTESIDHEDDPEIVADAIVDEFSRIYEEKHALLGDEVMKGLEANIMLRIIDTRWMEHLSNMDYLRTGIGLRAFGQRDPLVEYKNEAHRAFGEMTSGMYEAFLRTILRLQIAKKAAPTVPEQSDPLRGKISYSSPQQTLDDSSRSTAQRVQQAAAAAQTSAPVPTAVPKPAATAKPSTFVKDKDDPYANVGRNDLCPCGSGKKFKKCHGRPGMLDN